MTNGRLPRILIVEDDEAVATLQRRSLERDGFHVLTACTAEQAHEMLRDGDVELIVLDYRLPGGCTGLDFFEQLKLRGCDLPVIIVTGFSEEITVIRALRAGVRDFVTKSLTYLDYLPDAVRRVLHQVHTEDRVREQAALLDKVRDAIFVRDLEGRIQFWNASAERLYGWQATEAIGANAFELLEGGDSPQLRLASTTLLRNSEWTGELQQCTKDGRLLTVESHWTLVADGDWHRRSVLVVNTDVTEKRSVQSQLLHMQRMESIGTLAGGVAHEFNNLLQAIRGYTHFAMSGLAADDTRRRDLDQVLAAAERATSLTRQLLTFGRREPLSKRMVDPNHVVADLVKMLRPLIGVHIDVVVSLQPGASAVYADPSQLHQAIMNLCLNARDAMPDGGRLVLKTDAVELTEEFCRRNPGSRAGPHVLLTVSDSGCGMSPEVRSRVFEPFFTTKETGRGTGLGLAMTYSMVQQHEGTIHVSSEPGKGTTFRMYLPAAGVEEANSDEQPLAEGANGGTEVVLVAEDDPLICGMLTRMLESAGYSVLVAADGDEALRSFEQHADVISLVILDSLMPKLSGSEVFASMKAIKPDLRAVLSSGNGINPDQVHEIADQGMIFLQKPFDTDTLLRVARTALDDGARPSKAELVGAVGQA